MSAARAGNDERLIPRGSSTRRAATSAYRDPVTSAISWPSTAQPELVSRTQLNSDGAHLQTKSYRFVLFQRLNAVLQEALVTDLQNSPQNLDWVLVDGGEGRFFGEQSALRTSAAPQRRNCSIHSTSKFHFFQDRFA